jgi:NADH dehydrogenase (ubiquinone) Fe-S protein 1
MDGLGSNIDVHTRGSDTMRILPRINEEVNEEWISDKSRHAFDGLRKQRLHIPLLRAADGTFKELTWEEALATAAQKLSSVNGDDIHGIIGQFNDLESILAFKDLLHRLNSENIDVRRNAPSLKADFRSQYLMNSRIVGIDQTDLLLLVGCNPRVEAPVLNARIRKAVELNGLQVGVIGSAPNLTYNYTHLGNSAATLKDLVDGKHPFLSEKLAKAELPMVLVSVHALERSDGAAIQNYINQLAEKTNIINKKEKWNGINILHTEASRVGALDLGIVPRNDLSSKKPKVVYLLGADNFRFEEIPEDAFVIYQGHIGDEGAYYADLILPGASYLEKNALFVNTDGRP